VPEAKITSKGQITVPKVIRDELGVSPGDRLDFTFVDGQVVVTPVRRRRLPELFGVLARRSRGGAAEGDALTPKELEERDAIEAAVARYRSTNRPWRRRTSTRTSSSGR
jgi:AbrB family looped-hinge helix DNA binding protein